MARPCQYEIWLANLPVMYEIGQNAFEDLQSKTNDFDDDLCCDVDCDESTQVKGISYSWKILQYLSKIFLALTKGNLISAEEKGRIFKILINWICNLRHFGISTELKEVIYETALILSAKKECWSDVVIPEFMHLLKEMDNRDAVRIDSKSSGIYFSMLSILRVEKRLCRTELFDSVVNLKGRNELDLDKRVRIFKYLNEVCDEENFSLCSQWGNYC